MAKTVVGSFNSYSEAQQVVDELANSGIDRDDISIVGKDTGERERAAGDAAATGSAAGKGALTGGAIGGAAGLIAGLAGLAIPGIGPIIAAGPIAAALAGAGVGAVAGGLIGSLTSAGVPEQEAGYYAEAVRRGGALVTVRADDDMADRVADIMTRHNAVDIHGEAESWRKSGWKGFDPNAQPLQATEAREGAGTVLPVVEEDLKVGKREIDRGGVRVYSRMTEQPVEEQVQLREEHARVERRPVDRPASQDDLAGFKEGTIEVRERAEEPVVSKQARVVEEVVVGKEATSRTETVRDSVRRTDVQVEPMDRGARSDADYRAHFEQTYAPTGASYDEYEPAYRYGQDVAADQRYRGRGWNEIESDLEHDWDTRSSAGRGGWNRVKDAVHRGWERASDTIERAIPGDSDRDGR